MMLHSYVRSSSCSSGTAASLLASGLAGSGVVCGALFGAYGARSTASMVERHTKEISDLSIIPVRQFHNDESLAVRLCVSGWLTSQEDVWEPWTIFRGDDTFALQWVSSYLDPIVHVTNFHGRKLQRSQSSLPLCIP